MKTVFEGQVNDQKFTDREEMNAYIARCIAEGTPISHMSYSTTQVCDNPQKPQCPCQGKAAIDARQQSVSWLKHIHQVNRLVPQPYTNVIGYIIPYIEENLEIVDGDISDEVVSDLKAKLEMRMAFLEKHIFSYIRTGQYDNSQVNEWLNLLIEGLSKKLDWATGRRDDINAFIKAIPNDKFFVNGVDLLHFTTYANIYDEVAGFCGALIDIIKDVAK